MTQFYPAFKLEDNPFLYADRRTEKRRLGELGYDIVKTSAIDLVKLLVSGGANTFIAGEKGCGKSTVIDDFDGEENFLCVSSPETFRELYNAILSYAFRELEDNQQALGFVVDTLLQENKVYVPQVRRPDGVMDTGNAWTCNEMRCPRNRRCNIMGRIGVTDDRERMIWSIVHNTPTSNNCPLREWLSIELCSSLIMPDIILLIDAPDILDGRDKGYFERYIMEMFSRGAVGQIIMMTTTEQVARLRPHSEYYMRWDARIFPKPDNGELKEILRGRINGDGIFPFKDDALEYLVTLSKGNPRTSIMMGRNVLLTMKEQRIENPVDVEYVETILSDTPGIGTVTIMEGIVNVVNELWEERGNEWVEAKEIVSRLNEDYGIKLKPQHMGHRIKHLKLEKNRGPYRKYKLKKVSLILE